MVSILLTTSIPSGNLPASTNLIIFTLTIKVYQYWPLISHVIYHKSRPLSHDCTKTFPSWSLQVRSNNPLQSALTYTIAPPHGLAGPLHPLFILSPALFSFQFLSISLQKTSLLPPYFQPLPIPHRVINIKTLYIQKLPTLLLSSRVPSGTVNLQS